MYIVTDTAIILLCTHSQHVIQILVIITVMIV